MPDPLTSLGLQARTARRLLRRRPPLAALFQPLDERLIFVVGSPRSGTTFLAGALGAVPGLVDLGEVAAVKAAVPELAALPAGEAAARLRRILATTRRLGLVGSLRPIEQTPECAYLVPAIRVAFPQASVVHIVRDGRDVVCSLLERGWLSVGRGGGDDAGLAYGPSARFWVEPERAEEFSRVGDARRAAWAWRRYVCAARDAGAHEVRYERLAADPAAVAADLAGALDLDAEALARALAAAHTTSVGRYRSDLSAAQLADVEQEAGALLAELGYV